MATKKRRPRRPARLEVEPAPITVRRVPSVVMEAAQRVRRPGQRIRVVAADEVVVENVAT